MFCPGNWSCDLSHAGKPSTSWATSPALCVFSILRQGLLSCLGWLDLNLQLAISFNLQSCLILQVPCPAFPWSLIQFYSKDLLIDTINKMRLWRFWQLTKGISNPNLSGPAQVELYPLYRWSEKNRKHPYGELGHIFAYTWGKEKINLEDCLDSLLSCWFFSRVSPQTKRLGMSMIPCLRAGHTWLIVWREVTDQFSLKNE